MNNFNQQLIKISNEFLDKHPQKIPVYTVVCYFYYVHGIFHEMPALCSRMIAMVPENKFFNLRDGIYPSSLGLLAVAMENNDIPRTRGLLKAIKEMNKILPEKMPEFNMPEHKVFILNAEPWIAYLNGLELYEEDPNKAIEEFQRAMDLVKQEQFSLSIEKDIPLLIELASIQTRIMNLKKVNNFKELSAIIESLMPDLRDRWIKIGKNRGKKWLNLSEREYEFERKCYHLGERGADLLEICFLSRSNIIEALKKMLENSEWNHSLLNEAREFFNKIGFVNEIKFTNKVDSFVNLTLKRMAIKECSNVKILSDEDQIELLRELQDTENLSKKIPPETISFFKELLQEYIKRERNIDGNEENLELKKEIHLVWYNNSEPKGEPISSKVKKDKIANSEDYDLLIVREETGTQVFINGQKSKSPPSKLAYRILRYVLQHKGRGGSAWNIAQHVWSKDFPGLIDEPKELAKAVIKESDLKKAQDLKKKIDYWSSRTRRKVIDLNKYLMKTLKIKLEAKELDEYELSPKTPNYCLIEKV